MRSKRSKIMLKKKETETSNITTVITALTRTKEVLQKMQYKKKLHLGITVARPLFRILSTKCSFLPPLNYFPIPIHRLPFPTSETHVMPRAAWQGCTY